MHGSIMLWKSRKEKLPGRGATSNIQGVKEDGGQVIRPQRNSGVPY